MGLRDDDRNDIVMSNVFSGKFTPARVTCTNDNVISLNVVLFLSCPRDSTRLITRLITRTSPRFVLIPFGAPSIFNNNLNSRGYAIYR